MRRVAPLINAGPVSEADALMEPLRYLQRAILTQWEDSYSSPRTACSAASSRLLLTLTDTGRDGMGAERPATSCTACA